MAPFVFQLKHCAIENPTGILKARTYIVQIALRFAVGRIFDKIQSGSIGIADQIIDRGMNPPIVLADDFVTQVHRHKFVDLGESSIGPTRPVQAELLADPFEDTASIAEEVNPVENGPARVTCLALSVQRMAQPD